jgi:uncharacterized membrane protein
VKYLIAVAYPDEDWAVRVITALHGMQRVPPTDLDDAVYFTRDSSGQIALCGQPNGIIECSGIWWGLVRMMIESLAGGVAALHALLNELGFDVSFVNRITAMLRPDWSTILVFVRHTPGDKLLPELSKYGGIVLQTPVCGELEANIYRAMARPIIQAAIQPS